MSFDSAAELCHFCDMPNTLLFCNRVHSVRNNYSFSILMYSRRFFVRHRCHGDAYKVGIMNEVLSFHNPSLNVAARSSNWSLALFQYVYAPCFCVSASFTANKAHACCCNTCSLVVLCCVVLCLIVCLPSYVTWWGERLHVMWWLYGIRWRML